MGVTVVRACWAQGYSGADHLLDDDGMVAVVGRRYRSLQAAATAAARAAGPQAASCAPAPVWVAYVVDGREYADTFWP